THRAHGRYALRLREAGRQVPPASQPPVEELCRIALGATRGRGGKHHGDVRHAAADVGESHIAIVLDVHLAVRRDIAYPAIVTHERDAPRRARHTAQTEPPTHDRAQAVRAHHDAGDDVTGALTCSLCTHAAHRAARVAHDIAHANAFLYARPRRASPVEQYLVEDGAGQRETAVAEPREAVRRRIVALNARAIGRAHDHARQVRGAGALAQLERVHVRENARGLRTQILRARLVAREARTFQHEDVHARTREMPCGGSARRPAAHDNDLRIHQPGISARRPSRLTRWNTPM